MDKTAKEEGIRAVKGEVRACRRCKLCETRNKPVIGEGSLDARIMFVGEAPGFNEDLQGKPFVGRAGKVLDDLLSLVGLKREDIYITNILKCRPPGNRNPEQTEIKACTPYLDRQISIIKPAVICPMGNFAAAYIFEKFGLKSESIGKVHGRVFRVRNLMLNAKVIPLYHPASAVYNPSMKPLLMEDFRALLKG